MFGRCINIKIKDDIYIQYYKDDSSWSAGNFISISSYCLLNVGDVYVDANLGILEDRYTIYIGDGTTGRSDYDVTAVQAQIGVADFSQESRDNDADAVVLKIEEKSATDSDHVDS